jgi:hypothetical protein
MNRITTSRSLLLALVAAAAAACIPNRDNVLVGELSQPEYSASVSVPTISDVSKKDRQAIQKILTGVPLAGHVDLVTNPEGINRLVIQFHEGRRWIIDGNGFASYVTVVHGDPAVIDFKLTKLGTSPWEKNASTTVGKKGLEKGNAARILEAVGAITSYLEKVSPIKPAPLEPEEPTPQRILPGPVAAHVAP